MSELTQEEARAAHRERFTRRLSEGENPQEVFEELYRSAEGDNSAVPWADMKPNPMLVDWLDNTGGFPERDLAADKPECVVVGCGLGDDAIELARRGAQVTAFDVSATAIEWACRRRIEMDKPPRNLDFEILDLFQLPDEMRDRFDIGFEAYTFQALPTNRRADVAASIRSLMREGGHLLFIAKSFPDGAEPDTEAEGPPWPVSIAQLKAYFVDPGHFELVADPEMVSDPDYPEIPRLRALLRAV
jgi:SAM-dependent methyltransferase